MWTNYDDEEIRKNLQTLYNKLPDSKKSSKLRGFINSPFGTDAFKTYSSKLQNWIDEDNATYFDEIESKIKAKSASKSIRDIDFDENYLAETIENLRLIKEERYSEAVQREAKDEDDRQFQKYQQKFRGLRDRRDLSGLRNLGEELLDEFRLTDKSQRHLLAITQIAIDNLEEENAKENT